MGKAILEWLKRELIEEPLRWLISLNRNYEKWSVIRGIETFKTVEHLDSYYKGLREDLQKDGDIINSYRAKKAELEAVGLRTTADLVLSPIARALATGVWHLTETALPKVLSWIDKFGEYYKLRKEELDAMKELARSGEFGLNAVVGFVLGITLYPSVMSVTNPIWRRIEHESDAKLRSGLLPPDTAIRGLWREVWTEEELTDNLEKLGFTDEQIEVLKKTAEYYPSPTDFIRFMVRETFREDVVKKYGYDEDYPREIENYTKKAGVSGNWMKHYWRAHWELPSPMMAYEMLHRGIISLDDVETILRIADYVPYFIPKMIEIAYTPFTRVDVRRMYKQGVLSYEEMVKSYMDIGYNQERAEKLAEWTALDVGENERDLTKSELNELFQIGAIPEERYKELMKLLGYSDEEVDYLLTMLVWRMKQATLKDEIAVLKEEFLMGVIDETTLSNQLDALNLLSVRRDRIMGEARREKLRRYKMPTAREIGDWYKKKLITEEQAIDLLVEVNTPERIIPLYLGKKMEA